MLRNALAKAFHGAALRSGYALRQAKRVRKPRILMYHAIAESDTSEELFLWQLEVLRQQFELIALAELLDRVAINQQTGNEIAITFDDGLRNHALVAYPLLAAHRVPATFFVCPGLIDSGAWIWNLELRLRLNLLGEIERTRLAAAVDSGLADTESLISRAKKLELDRRQEFEAQVQSLTREFEPSDQQVDRFAPMTWAQALSLDPAIVTLGSHSSSHPILTHLTASQRQAEITGSRVLLEQRIGRSADLFCYPNGDNDQSTLDLVRDSYHYAVTVRADFVEPDQSMYMLPRIPAGESRALFMRRLHRPTA